MDQQNPTQNAAAATPKPRRPLPHTPAASPMPPARPNTPISVTPPLPARPHTPLAVNPSSSPNLGSRPATPTPTANNPVSQMQPSTMSNPISYASAASGSSSSHTPIPPSSFYGSKSTKTAYNPVPVRIPGSDAWGIPVDNDGSSDSHTPIPPSSFYGSKSTKTAYMPVPVRIPGSDAWGIPVNNDGSSDDDDDEVPPMTDADAIEDTDYLTVGPPIGTNTWWGNQSGSTDYGGGVWDNNANANIGNGNWDTDTGQWEDHTMFADFGKVDENDTMNLIPIDGRKEEEEESWWEKDKFVTLGPGLLPPVLANQIHDPEHTLFEVIVRIPDIKPSSQGSTKSTRDPPPAPTSEKPPHGSRLPSSTSTLEATGKGELGTHIPPTPSQILGAVPHPKAYYCPKDNCWVIFEASVGVPPLRKDFDSRGEVLPDIERRLKMESCVPNPGSPGAETKPKNKTHHFHYYPRAVPASKALDPPFRRGVWENASPSQGTTVSTNPLISISRSTSTSSTAAGETEAEAEAMEVVTEDQAEASGGTAEDVQDENENDLLLDLYICCQCSVYCVVSPSPSSSTSPPVASSDLGSTILPPSAPLSDSSEPTSVSKSKGSARGIPPVIPPPIWFAFIKDRLTNPNPALINPPGKDGGRKTSKELGLGGEHTLVVSLETLLIVIQNHLWKGEGRKIKVNGPGFSKRLGWNLAAQQVLYALGFTSEQQHNEDIILRPPLIDVDLGSSGSGAPSQSGSPNSSDRERERTPSKASTPIPGLGSTPSTSSLTKSRWKGAKSSSEEVEQAQRIGRANRAKLLRAWVEIGAWLVDWKRRNAKAVSLLPSYTPFELHITLDDSVREKYQAAVGAHVDQLPRADLPDTFLMELRTLSDRWLVLGLTPESYSPDLLTFAYLAQRRCSPPQTPVFYTALMKIIHVFLRVPGEGEEGGGHAGAAGGGAERVLHDSSVLKLCIAEDLKGRWVMDDLDKAVRHLGFDGVTGMSSDSSDSSGLGSGMDVDMDLSKKKAKRKGGFLQMEYDDDVPEEFIVNAWRECVKRMAAGNSSSELPSYSAYSGGYNSYDGGGDTHMFDATSGAGAGQLILYDGSQNQSQSGGIETGQGEEDELTPRKLSDALRIIAQSRGSKTLIALWESCKSSTESPEKAYDVLEVPKEIDDGMLITVYQMRVEEQPTQLEKMQKALYMIAEIRNSTRLREFARTSRDPGEYVAPTRSDWPRGLNQLGNTCYLNSLLQYFYTIKELRASVLRMGGSAMAAISHAKATGMYLDEENDNDKGVDADMKLLSDDMLKKHRVGGRMVTRREIVRSKQFVSHLADLFHSLEYAENPAVTPSIELAKLALVTSKDEEVDDESTTTDKSGSAGGSDDTDATLVDDIPGLVLGSGGAGAGPSGSSNNANAGTSEPPPQPSGSNSNSNSTSSSPPPRSRSPTYSPTHSSSVLGKRPRDLSKQDTELIDSSSGLLGDSTSTSTLLLDASPPPDSIASLGSTTFLTAGAGGQGTSASGRITPDWAIDIDTDDVVMRDASPIRRKTPPPLPPRKPPAPVVNNDSVMMFGKQHDVAECMDNCMFQIETALLKFDDDDDSGGLGETEDDPDSEKASVVKRLFYGQIRQTFIETLKGVPTTHQKTDLFSHLPVNVGTDAEQGEFGFDIYDGLGRYFDDTIEYEGQRVSMEVGLVKVPPLLQVQLQRVQFNRELLQSWKSQAYVKFGETLYMDRFMDNADPDKRKRSKAIQDELNGCRERLKLLSEGKGKSTNIQPPEPAPATANPSSLDIDIDIPLAHPLPPTPPQISQEQERDILQAEMTELRTRIPRLKAELGELWQYDTSVAYELTSVFIHRGNSPSFGHYFFYSRNLPDKPDEWFKYNDEDVTEIPKEEVLRDTTGDTANPYLLVFTRKGSQVVETVNRFDPSKFDDDAMS